MIYPKYCATRTRSLPRIKTFCARAILAIILIAVVAALLTACDSGVV